MTVLCIGLLGACHAHGSDVATFDHCDCNPPDSVPPPPISVRASADSPSVVLVSVSPSGPASSAYAILDGNGKGAYAARARFDGITPGTHRLIVRSFGYGTRDTVITVPGDAGLIVNVPLTRGGGVAYCASYIVEKK